MREITLAVLMVLFCAVHSQSAEPASPAGRSRPNILLILADDLGYGDLGCYNPQAKAPTPNVDRLAREGMRFTDAHSPSTVCTPTRYSILTGRMAFRIPYRGVFAGVGGPCLIEDGRLTLPQLLRQQGYATALTGKWHVGLTFLDANGERIIKGGVEGVKLIDYSRPIPDAPIHRGFDRFFGTACCPTTDFLYAFIDGDRIPVPPTGLLDKMPLPKHPYANDNRLGMVAPGFDLEEVDMVFLKKSQEFLEDHVRTKPRQPFFLMHSAQAVHLPSFPGRDFKGKTQAGPHGDFIFEFDHVVGELLKTLERLGVAGNTLVIVTSDNGPETTSVIHMRADHGHDGARPWRGMKRDQWEGGHRVPFIVRWPGRVKPGSVSDQTLCLTDLMATCAAITNARLPENAAEDSFNLLPALLGADEGKPIRPYTLHQTPGLALAIRRGPWKYLDHRGSGGNNYGSPDLKPFALPEAAPDAPGQLYNLQADPGEKDNLYLKQPQIVSELKAVLDDTRQSGRSAPKPVPPAKAFDASWESLERYECPEWFRDAKLGVYVHWGLYSVSAQGCWYGRHMYDERRPEYAWHVKKFGHPSQFGYKDLIPLWRAERFDPDAWLALFKDAGARYFTPCAVHHDGFDLWDSQHAFNSVKMGPRKDIIRALMEATRRHGLRWGVTTHFARNYNFFQTGYSADSRGPQKGIPYIADTPENRAFYHSSHGDTNPKYPRNPSEEFKRSWASRVLDLIDRYDVDVLYFDGAVPFDADDGLTGRRVLAHYYNRGQERHGGNEVVMTIKTARGGHGIYREGVATLDCERFVLKSLNGAPWQTDDTIGVKYWSHVEGMEYRSVDYLVDKLVDIVSKNGNLLLNVPPRADGTFDEQATRILRELGQWNRQNGEAIFGTRPWTQAAEGDVRFTRSKDGRMLYAIFLKWPENGQAMLKSLAAGAEGTGGAIRQITLLGSDKKVDHRRDADGLHLTLPERTNPHAVAVKIQLAE